MAHQTPWRQVNITYPGPSQPERERQAISHLAAVLPAAENAGLITSWWYIRKGAWRIRYLLNSEAGTDPVRPLLCSGTAWTSDIYEPETFTFGGPASMNIAHTLFHYDSRNLLTYLRKNPRDRREHSIVLCTALMRSAALDIYEQGDVWARIAEQRATAATPESRPSPSDWAALTSSTRHLILGTPRPGAITPDWLTAFETAGSQLRTARERGQLTRGLRAIITQHVIFHWNRIGLPGRLQAILARAAADAIFRTTPE